ncbi:putative immunity protein [Streptomyces sp. NPDC001478]
MTDDGDRIALSTQDLRAVTAFAASCAHEALRAFENDRPGDTRPRDALAAADEFANGGARGKALRDTASAALKAAASAETEPGRQAAWAAMSAAAAAYLHPLARATQVKHILGAGAHAARTAELLAGDDRSVGPRHLRRLAQHATPHVVDVLTRFPAAPDGGGRVGELTRLLDTVLRTPGPVNPLRGGGDES